MCLCVLQGTLRRVTFSVVSQPQDGGCYDSGLEDSETPSSKSSSGPRLGALPLPEEGYERTTPEGSVGEEEHVENGQSQRKTHAQTFGWSRRSEQTSSFIPQVLCLSRLCYRHARARTRARMLSNLDLSSRSPKAFLFSQDGNPFLVTFFLF